MSGLLKPDSCSIHYQGLDLSWKQAKHFIQKDIIYLHQQPYLFDASVVDNIAYGLYRAGENKTNAHKKVIQALEWADLSSSASFCQAAIRRGKATRCPHSCTHFITTFIATG